MLLTPLIQTLHLAFVVTAPFGSQNSNFILNEGDSSTEQQSISSSPYPLFETLLTAEETTVHLRCHLKPCKKMAREGRMPSIRRGERHFFRLSDLDQWLQGMQRINTTI
jgi:hypothetical protein